MTQQIHKRPRILIADDDQAIRQLVRTIIQRERLDVDCASDGAEAVELLSKHEYDVILVDLMMPRTDGFGVIEHLRLHPPAHKPVVLVLTAFVDQTFKEVDPTIVAGVLRKPFEVAELGHLVRLCVNGHDAAAHQRLSASRDSTMRELAMRRFSIVRDDNGESKAN
jgi:CheY-like chemotaxis protein